MEGVTAPFGLDLACLVGKRRHLSALARTVAFLAPSVPVDWGDVRHLHQDMVSCLMCLAWTFCQPQLVSRLQESHRNLRSNPSDKVNNSDADKRAAYLQSAHNKEPIQRNESSSRRWASGIDKLGFLDKLEFTLALLKSTNTRGCVFF